MQELDPPLSAIVTSFDALDRVGRLLLDTGEELRFGESACDRAIPSVGARVFVTVVAPHLLGGHRAMQLRSAPISEAQLRAVAEEEVARRETEFARERDVRREALRGAMTSEAIVARIKASLGPEESDDADAQVLYALVDDLKLVGPSIEHVRAILRAIATSPSMAHFGSPGPLVHFLEQHSEAGGADAFFEAASVTPTSHFLLMLCRCVNGGGDLAARARPIIERYAVSASAPTELRRMAADFLDEVAV